MEGQDFEVILGYKLIWGQPELYEAVKNNKTKNETGSLGWWHMFVIPALGRLVQEDH